MKFSHTLKTTASPECIWEIWTDVARWSNWDTELKDAGLQVPFSLGAVGELVPKKGRASTFKISQFSSGSSYTFTVGLPLCRLNVHRYLTTHSDGLYFTHEVSFQGLLAFIFGLLLGRRFKAVLPSIMANVRQIAEAANQP
jgi:hypothetical protein